MERHGQGPPAPVPADPGPLLRASPATDVLVVFASRHGATRGVAERIAARLHEGGLAVTLSQVEDVGAMPPGCAVVLGSPVYDQGWPPEFDEFVARHMQALAGRRTWLFSVGTFGDRRRVIGPLMRREPRNIGQVRETMRPDEYRVFAGVIRREQWPLLSRVLFHLFGGRLGDNRDWVAIDEWAETILATVHRTGAARAA
jgi:menaquinone-dependent protoporphyrinogen oxidase